MALFQNIVANTIQHSSNAQHNVRSATEAPITEAGGGAGLDKNIQAVAQALYGKQSQSLVNDALEAGIRSGIEQAKKQLEEEKRVTDLGSKEAQQKAEEQRREIERQVQSVQVEPGVSRELLAQYAMSNHDLLGNPNTELGQKIKRGERITQSDLKAAGLGSGAVNTTFEDVIRRAADEVALALDRKRDRD